MHSKNPLPKIDHGVDIIGDEWDDPEEEPEMPPKIKMEKRYDPVHPYCTNWPMSNRKEEDENI
jgi:hypothetical protein